MVETTTETGGFPRGFLDKGMVAFSGHGVNHLEDALSVVEVIEWGV